MTVRSLFEPVIDGGIRDPNWFEGRLLTAEALRAKDDAERERERILGRAIGAGVSEGLWLTRGAADPNGLFKTLTITKGSALTDDGDVLVLGQDISVDVVPPPSAVNPGVTLFARCQTPPLVATIPSGFGIYVLVMSSAADYRERAEMSGLGQEGVVTGCGDAFVVEGVRFRLEKLEPNNISSLDATARSELTELIAESADAASRSRLRNLIAHYCLGTPALARFAVDPFARSAGQSSFAKYGALDDLRALKRLGCCDVPIGVLLWNATGIGYLDVWSARRPPTTLARSSSWPLPTGERLRIEGIARFLQFQQQLAELIAESSAPTGLRADDYFRFLPAAGLLPVSGASKGLQLTTFLADRALNWPRPPLYSSVDGPIVLEGTRLPPLLNESFTYAPVELASDPLDRIALWVYRLRENTAALDQGALDVSAPAIVFASAQIPYAATPRFNVARFDYSNFSSALLGPF